MSKVKITEEQAREIEIRKQNFSNESTIKKHLEGWEIITTLNSLTLDELIRALYIGYEIEPEYKIGDWIVNVYNEDVGIVTELGSSYLKYDDGLSDGFHNFRHATPEEVAEEKQRRFWHGNGREVWELKRYDLLSRETQKAITVNEVSETGVKFNEFAMFKKWDDVKRNFKIACFAHDRKDIKND